MAISKENVSVNIKLGNKQLEQVNDFVYVGVIISKDRSCDNDNDIQNKISKTSVIVGKLEECG